MQENPMCMRMMRWGIFLTDIPMPSQQEHWDLSREPKLGIMAPAALSENFVMVLAGRMTFRLIASAIHTKRPQPITSSTVRKSSGKSAPTARR